MQTNRNPKKVCAQIGLGLFTMLLSWIVFSSILSVVFMKQIYAGNGILLWLVNDIPLYFVGVPLFLLFLKFIPDGAEPEREAMKMNPGRFLLLLGFCLGATYLLSYVGLLITELVNLIKGGSNGGALGLDSLLEGNNIFVNLFFGAVIPALGEEFVFRYMLRRKMKGSGDKTYMIFSALSFALFHVNHVQGLYAFVIGLALAWIYLRTGKLLYTISLHFIINTLGLVFFPFLVELENGELIAGLIMITLILLAIVLFFVYFKRVRNGLMPPSEPGWPYKSPYPLQAPIAMAGAAYPGTGNYYGVAPQQAATAKTQPFGRPYFSYSNLLPVQLESKQHVSYNNVQLEAGKVPAPSLERQNSPSPERGYAYNNLDMGNTSYANMQAQNPRQKNTNSINSVGNNNFTPPMAGQMPMNQGQPIMQGQGYPAYYGAQRPIYPGQPMPPQQVYYGAGQPPYYQPAYNPYYGQYGAQQQGHGYIPQNAYPYQPPYYHYAPPVAMPPAYNPYSGGYGANPYANWQGGYSNMPPMPPVPYGYIPKVQKRPSMASVCFANVGMILYMILAGIMILLTMATL